ncbi:MAG: LarC family nickel insertion protein [Myxococcota bacterium]
MRIHLDPVGGVAGDMFVAAILDAWPELEEGLREAVGAVQLPERLVLDVLPHRDHALAGTRFRVQDAEASGHPHRRFAEIRKLICGSALAAAPRARAIEIFELLAEAEGGVHGLPSDEVTFHEVGAWDSIVDVVAAAFLIDALGASGWSVASLPIGSGFVESSHGELPVPAPATVRLLRGFVLHDDGLPGERVTPTGAAILRHLTPEYGHSSQPARLGRSGTGFGTRRLPGRSNVLRVLALEPLVPSLSGDQIAVLRFEVDDQPAEDLAIGLDHLRSLRGVQDVLQVPALGKKGRLVAQVQVLAAPDSVDAVARACFSETTTLGLRWHTERRAVLERSSESYRGCEGSVRVKSAQRPSGVVTRKADVDDVADAGGFAERQRLRREAEAAPLRDRDV